MPLSSTSSWISETRREVSRMASLPEGWDGAGSPPLQGAAISAATRLLEELESFEELPSPSVGPIVGGGLGMTWRYGSRVLILEFLPDGEIEFLKSEKQSSSLSLDDMQDGQIPPENLREARTLLDWLIQGC